MGEREGLRPGPVRIVAVDGHPLILCGLRSVAIARDDVDIVGTAGSLAAASALRSIDHDVVLAAEQLPDGPGLCLLADLRLAAHPVHLLLLAEHPSEDTIARARWLVSNGPCTRHDGRLSGSWMT